MLLAACARYFAPDLHLKRHATEPELVGRWQLTPPSLALARRDGYDGGTGRAHEIVLHQDHVCEFRSLVQSARSVEYLATRGTWQLARDTGSPGGKKRKNELQIRVGPRLVRFYLSEEKGRLLLWNFWGDPDLWELTRYEK